MVRVSPYGATELQWDGYDPSNVYKHRDKYYMESTKEVEICENLSLSEVWVVKEVELCHDVESSTLWKATHRLTAKVWVPNISMSCHDVKSKAS